MKKIALTVLGVVVVALVIVGVVASTTPTTSPPPAPTRTDVPTPPSSIAVPLPDWAKFPSASN